ncbi:polysaccharide biosynthesis protein [Ancylothrix sp. C2]|nr:polysaccharide biosynthesis protein [Ancylothrix sp. D3o]
MRRLLKGEMGRPKRVTVFSRDEGKHHQMKVDWKQIQVATDDIFYRNFEELLEFRVGDVRDYHSVLTAVRKAEVVFHAAALKQVPSCEYFPAEAVRTNVEGAINLVRAVRENDTPVELVVGISTDKACKPVNVMGMTKSLQERILLEANLGQDNITFTCVRYGNVISSRGSVVPLFKHQIQHGGPVTITSGEMTRFLITLDQAVDTVFDCVRFGKPGETFVPRLPSTKISDLVEVLINGREIPVVEIGVRPGEKLHEIMISEEEMVRTTERGKYYVIGSVLPEISGVYTNTPPLEAEYSSQGITLESAGLYDLLKQAGELEFERLIVSSHH